MPLPMWSGAGKVVLVIDDEADVRGLFKRMLEATGFAVILAADGLAGAAAFRDPANAVDVVLLDLSMPRQGGVETFRQLRAVDPGAKVILTTGFGPNAAANDFEGLAATLAKPFRVQELLDAVFRVLQPGG